MIFCDPALRPFILNTHLPCAGFFVCKLKKMSNTKRDVAAEGGKDGEADPEDTEPAGVPDHDGTPSKLFPGAKGGKGAAKRKGEPHESF